MKNLILLSLIMLPFLMFSQSRSSIDFMFSPDFTYRTFKVPNDDKFIKRLYDSIEKPNLGFHFGLNYSRKIAKKVYLSGGLQFSTAGYHTQLNDLVFPDDINSNGPVTNITHSVKLSYDYYLINLPVELQYLFSENKFSPYFKIGLSPTYNMYRRTKTVLDMEEPRIRKDFNVNHYTAFIQFGIGGILKLNDKWQIFAQPTFRYQITAAKSPENKDYLYSIGIELGARMSL
jgi:Outer membrane protein beta-barrel domain